MPDQSEIAVLEAARAWMADGHAVALATVVRTWGSSPRPAGSHLAVRDDGTFLGSVSGGCVEGAVVEEAGGVMKTGAPKMLEFGVTNERAWEVGLACGGTVRIYVEPANPETLDALLSSIEHRRAVVLATALKSGDQRLLGAGDGTTGEEHEAVARTLRTDRCEIDEADEAPPIFYQPFNPPLRMMVVGAVHIAQPLSSMAALAGYEVTVVDPRESFASAERFPGVALDTQWPDAALEALGLDHRCAVVTLTHDPKLDDPALQVALRSSAFFIGCLGSKKTHASRLRRLEKAGFTEDDLARVHGPVGLPIGSRSPAEIAVSILAQATQTLRA